MSSRLVQLADEAPSFITQTQGRFSSQGLPHSSSNFSEAPPCDDELDQIWDYVDWSMCEDTPGPQQDLEHHGGQDAVSLPSLTSGTSDDGSPHAPASPIEDDGAGRARLRDLKQHDDALSFPQRELKPKNPSYPLQIIESQGSSGAGHFFGAQRDAFVSAPSFPLAPSSYKAAAPSRHDPASRIAKSGRGRRSGPLPPKNRDDTADVRERGACNKCRIKRIKCGTQDLCENCQTYYKKLPFGHLMPSGYDMCIRTPLVDIGPAFEKTHAPMPAKFNVHREGIHWEIRFDPHIPNGLPVRVQELWTLPTTPMSREPELWHVFQRPQVPTEDSLVKWSQLQMGYEPDEPLQASLDRFVALCCQSPGFSHQELTLLRKVHKLRCMYRIWKPRPLFYLDMATGMIYELPKYVMQDLRGIARSSISSLERDLHATFDKFLKASKTDKFYGFHPVLVWACLMQLTLTYRDISNVMAATHARYIRPGFGQDQVLRTVQAKKDEVGRKASNLARTLAVECDTLFLKHNSADAPSDFLTKTEFPVLSQVLMSELGVAAVAQTQFFACINEMSSPLDCFLKALLARPEPKQNKRRKTSA